MTALNQSDPGGARAAPAAPGAARAAAVGQAGDASTSDGPGTDAPTSRIVVYLHSLGVRRPASAQRVAAALDECVDPALNDPAGRMVAQIEAFETWMRDLAQAAGLSASCSLDLVCAQRIGQWLDRHPEAIELSTAAQPVVEALQAESLKWGKGLLPLCAQRQMSRQSLGELPMVLRGRFWSGTYKWVLPAARAMRRQNTLQGDA